MMVVKINKEGKEKSDERKGGCEQKRLFGILHRLGKHFDMTKRCLSYFAAYFV